MKLHKPKGFPKYSKGDLVTEKILNEGPLEIESSFWNGFTWMYYFKDKELGLGQDYLTPISTPLTS